jgi:hypothetical protein
MSKDAQPLLLNRGEDASIPMTAGTSTDVTGWTMAFCVATYQVGPGGTMTSGFPLTVGSGITVVTAASGVLRITIPKATTSAMTAPTYQWGLWRTNSGSSELLAAGTITMSTFTGPP